MAIYDNYKNEVDITVKELFFCILSGFIFGPFVLVISSIDFVCTKFPNIVLIKGKKSVDISEK